ncbi:MAG: YqgE/AlgH family protein, partial [Alphaproteobacteria bacterium]
DGPRHALLALGYAGWGPGQLESEIQENAWLSVPYDDALVFDVANPAKWERAFNRIGVDLSVLSGTAGRA